MAMLDLTQQENVPWTPEPHTPTPWSEFADGGDWWIQGKDAEGNPIGLPVCDANDMSAADMLFIIRAVNAHDALVEAAQLALHKIEQTLDGQYTDGARPTPRCAREGTAMSEIKRLIAQERRAAAARLACVARRAGALAGAAGLASTANGKVEESPWIS